MKAAEKINKWDIAQISPGLKVILVDCVMVTRLQIVRIRACFGKRILPFINLRLRQLSDMGARLDEIRADGRGILDRDKKSSSLVGQGR